MPDQDDARYDLDRFLDDLRSTGTVITGPVADEPLEWQVRAHRGMPADRPYRLALDEWEFADAVERDARLIESRWPGGDARERAYTALLLSFDAALVGVDRTPHGFVLDRHEFLQLTTHHPCPDPMPHLDPAAEVGYEASYGWYAGEPGTPEFEAERAERARESRHRRHSHLVLGYLEVEAADDGGGSMDAAMGLLQDQLSDAFGHDVFQRRSAYLERHGFPSTAELSRVMHEQDERFDEFLDALAGECRDG